MKIIKLTEAQVKGVLYEAMEDEGLYFKRGKQGNKVMSYRQGANSKIDDEIFNDDKSLKVRKMVLPKSKVTAYNLYDIKDMIVNKSLKHGMDVNKNRVDRDVTVETFINRSVLLIKHIIGNRPVDIITYPQSSSNFNREMASKLIGMYPQSEGIRLQPNMLVKNVRNMFVNVDTAREAGLDDRQIYAIQKKVEKWKKDEDIRDLRRNIEKLQNEIAEILSQRKDNRGRPSKVVLDKKKQIELYNNDIRAIRKGIKGKDPTIDKTTGNVKGWEIKSIDDKERRAIEGMFVLNPELRDMQYKLRGKNIVLFDDNISSGATLDDVCLALQQLNVGSIMAFTLGTIAPTIYNPKERFAKQNHPA